MNKEGSGRLVDFNLYLVTDRKACSSRPLLEIVGEALNGGAKSIQLREKDLPARDLYELALEMRDLTRRYGARLFINDRIDIALAVDADGVHLGERSMPADMARRLLGVEKLIGVSCHGVENAIAARERGADFLTFGPVFFTPSKAAYGEPVGISALSEATRLAGLPVFAIGGIGRRNVKEVVNAGAAGIALISAILAAGNPRGETEALLSLLNAGKLREE